MTYKVDSPEAEEFIHHEEILETLEYARTNKDNRALIEQLIEKAALCKGLTHREAAVLLECDQPDLIEHIFHLAKEIKQKFYGRNEKIRFFFHKTTIRINERQSSFPIFRT